MRSTVIPASMPNPTRYRPSPIAKSTFLPTFTASSQRGPSEQLLGDEPDRKPERDHVDSENRGCHRPFRRNSLARTVPSRTFVKSKCCDALSASFTAPKG